VSAGTNVPVQHLGHPELMSNRNVAENTMEDVDNFVMSEQEGWRVFINEIFNKAIDMRNKAAGARDGKLNKFFVESVLTSTTERQLLVLKDIKIPLASMNQWSWKEVRRNVPTASEPEEIEEELEEQRAKSEVARPGISPVIPAATTASLITAAASDDEDLIEGADTQIVEGGGSA